MIQFSIILPVRNGGEYIKECVESILLQSVPDFNLIIMDSGSTDGTIEWVLSLKDSRIHLIPSPMPLSIEENWGRIKNVARYEFMTIIGHDDLLHPDYLQVMKSLILEQPKASLYAPHFNLINATGEIIRRCKEMPLIQNSEDLLEKFILQEIDAVGLMMRSSDYDRVNGIPSYPGLLFADFPLWIELTRISYKATSMQTCLSYRVHKRSTTATSNIGNYFSAYDLYINYLAALKEQDPVFRDVINRSGRHLLRSRCLEFSKKLLSVKKQERKRITSIEALANTHKLYADRLIDNNTFNPSRLFKIRVAKSIDATSAGRYLYLLYKRFSR